MSFIFKILTFIYAVISYFERKVFIKNIGKNDLVLDIGSGDKPFWRADVIVDKYLEDSQQRHTGSMLYDKRKIFIQADVENLPFKDKVFDFVFCSHLLEHVKNPDRAINELTRVARRGYLEIPNAILDLFSSFPPHLWFCDYQDGILIFRQRVKEKDFFRENIEKFGRTIFNNNIFQYLLAKQADKIFISLSWGNKINYKIIRAKDKKDAYGYKENLHRDETLSLKINHFLYKILYEIIVFLFYRKKDIKIEKIMK